MSSFVVPCSGRSDVQLTTGSDQVVRGCQCLDDLEHLAFTLEENSRVLVALGGQNDRRFLLHLGPTQRVGLTGGAAAVCLMGLNHQAPHNRQIRVIESLDEAPSSRGVW